ncbi:WD40 repeat domain-containing protein [Streptomyces cyaneochromogenes]|uniref:WD40 repeat domain-containing protein n=1 Tax=Streptomyces cyaneochromogenes TaxID=2496836 RepID=A0A3Q9EQF4_9ACTN|nr:WD40 repeat domain-containing protein [Streptomyces cyaneochromogenes]AZQ36829.1 WD40 repeat domain-containing protein [Streptomyces cyaneochromogenes]
MTYDVFWGDWDGAVWRGSVDTGPHAVLAPPRPVRDSETGELKDQAVTSLAFHPDGKILAVGRPGELQLWDVRRQPPRPLPGGGGDVVGNLAFSRDGEYLAGLDHGHPDEEWYRVCLRRADAQGGLK